MAGRPKILVISGSVGAGKTSTAETMSKQLSKQGLLHAVIDMDYLVYSFPRPKDDYFHRRLGRKNLAAIWPNYEAIGVKCLIIPNVVENQEDVQSIQAAIPDSEILIVRLRAKIETVHARLHERESGETLKWHLNRAVELTKQLDDAEVEDFVIDTDNKTVDEVADELIKIWLGSTTPV
jgi:adenylylsulfate kinase